MHQLRREQTWLESTYICERSVEVCLSMWSILLSLSVGAMSLILNYSELYVHSCSMAGYPSIRIYSNQPRVVEGRESLQ